MSTNCLLVLVGHHLETIYGTVQTTVQLIQAAMALPGLCRAADALLYPLRLLYGSGFKESVSRGLGIRNTL